MKFYTEKGKTITIRPVKVLLYVLAIILAATGHPWGVLTACLLASIELEWS